MRPLAEVRFEAIAVEAREAPGIDGTAGLGWLGGEGGDETRGAEGAAGVVVAPAVGPGEGARARSQALGEDGGAAPRVAALLLGRQPRIRIVAMGVSADVHAERLCIAPFIPGGVESRRPFVRIADELAEEVGQEPVAQIDGKPKGDGVLVGGAGGCFVVIEAAGQALVDKRGEAVVRPQPVERALETVEQRFERHGGEEQMVDVGGLEAAVFGRVGLDEEAGGQAAAPEFGQDDIEVIAQAVVKSEQSCAARQIALTAEKAQECIDVDEAALGLQAVKVFTEAFGRQRAGEVGAGADVVIHDGETGRFGEDGGAGLRCGKGDGHGVPRFQWSSTRRGGALEHKPRGGRAPALETWTENGGASTIAAIIASRQAEQSGRFAMREHWTWRRAGVVALGLAVVALGGCQGEDEGRKQYVLEGTAESIDARTGEVSMRWFNSKRNKEVVINGRVSETTEVFINGKLARFEDVRPQEQVRVTGYKEGKGEAAIVVVTKVEVQRPDWDEAGTAATPAAQSQAAERPSDSGSGS